ncbi:MAG: fluoride efflux transporter CrcB [Muribaculaceae bacterium]|nr:fluoride efflux transporter CrcB [Muribaculaceae bacterium]
MLQQVLIVGAGGFAGSAFRFLVVSFAGSVFRSSFAWGTLSVNLAGCFLFGLLAGLLEKCGIATENQSLLLLTGFCGGFTTFSAFSADILSMLDRGQFVQAVAYAVVSIFVGIALLWAGRGLLRLF